MGAALWFLGGSLAATALAVPTGAQAAGETIFVDGAEGGLTCRTVDAGPVSIDVPSVRIAPQFRLNGQPFPTGSTHSASFFLVPREGEAVPLGNSFSPQPVRVLPGVYDVEYRWRSGTLVPRNVGARVEAGLLLQSDQTLVIDVPSREVEGALTMNGAAFPAAGGDLFLEGVYSLGRVDLGTTADGAYARRVIPGAYRFGYEAVTPGLFLPANARALRERHEIEAAPGVRVLNLDLPSVTATFQFRINGQLAPGMASENGAISLRTADGDRIDLGETRQQNVGWRFVPGRYDIHYRRLTGGILVPANAERRFVAGRNLGAGAHVLDVPAVAIEGPILINGSPPPGSPIESGRVIATDSASGSDTTLGFTDDGQFGVMLIPGSYDVAYERSAGSASVPYNAHTVFQLARNMTTAGQHPVDVPMAITTLLPRLQGDDFPNLASENARLLLRPTLPGVDTLVAETRAFDTPTPLALQLLPGTYHPVLERIAGFALIPANSRALIDVPVEVPPVSPGARIIDIRTGFHTFDFRHNGDPFPSGADNSAAFELRHHQDVVQLGTTNDAPLPRLLVHNVVPLDDGRTGTIHYRWQSGGGSAIPRNVGTPAACIRFAPD